MRNTLPAGVPGANVESRRMVMRALFVAVAAASVITILSHVAAWFHTAPVDLRAFVASGQVVGRDKADPYLVQPLLDRERALVKDGSMLVAPSPVPLPPYVVVAFALAAHLPMRVAVAIAALLLLAACATSSVLVSRMGSLPLGVATAAVLFGTAYTASSLGQVAPIAIAALVTAAWCLRCGRPVLAGSALVISLIQPQMSATAVLAALLFVPRARAVIVAGIVVLVLVPTLVLGPGIWHVYAETLPIHAAAELRFPEQYSLSWLARALGASDPVALGLGAASSVVFGLVALALCARHRDRFISDGAIVLVPAMFAVIGGSFIHVYQLTFALIPALIFVRSRARPIDVDWALAFLVLPFGAFTSLLDVWPTKSAWITLVFVVLTAWSLIYCMNEKFGRQFAMRKASLATCAAASMFVIMAILRPRLHFGLMAVSVTQKASDNASLGWAAVCEAVYRVFAHTPYLIAVKSVVWISVIVAIGAVQRNLTAEPATEIAPTTE